jgi:hypothetical protein
MQQSTTNRRGYAVVLGTGAIVLVLFMVMHPMIHSHDAQGFMEEASQKASMTSIVHSVLIATMALVVLGFTGMCDWLGSRQLLVRSGLIAYITGAIAGTIAATINGLVVPASLNNHEDDAAEIAQQLHSMLSLCHVIGEEFSQMLVVACSVAVALWSLALLLRGGGLRIIGIVGLVCGLLPALLMLVGHLHMDVHGVLAFIIAQAIWYMVIAVAMFRSTGA